MGKFLIRFFFLIVISAIILILYLSFFGIKTDKFDNLIKGKANEVNRHVKLNFQETKIHINPKKFNLVVKLQSPKILIKNNTIDLSKLDLYLSLKSFFSSDFLLKKAEVAFVRNDIKDLAKITNIFLPRIINKQLKKVFAKGNLEGEFNIPFDPNGDIGEDYGFSGKVSDASIILTKDFAIKNFTTEIQHGQGVEEGGFAIKITKGSLLDLELAGTIINLKREKDKTKIKSLLHTKGKLNTFEVKKMLSLFDLNKFEFKDIDTKVDLKTNINFYLSKRLKIKDLSYKTEGKISSLELQTKEKKIIRRYLANYDPKLVAKDIIVKLTKSKSNQTAELRGLIKIREKFDNFKINEKYDYKKKNFAINGLLDLTNSEVNISRLNYKKNSGKKSQLLFDINFNLNKNYNIKNLELLEGNTKIKLAKLILNKNFEIIDFKNINVKTFSDGVKNNDFSASKSKKIIINGEVFDAQYLLKSLYKKDARKTFGKNFKSHISVNFEKTLTGTNDDVSNFAMIAFINNGSYEKLSLKGNFSKNEIIEMSIYQVDKDKKTLQVISDRARPFIKNFDFVKGFEGGKLEYESIISKNISNSKLTITDFKVSKVPALAKLLTLASLQGIADTLSGEGIRFDSFEMKSNSEGNVLNIEDALAIGPAVSILLEGYVDKGKVVSLRGTLVPATKLNAIIASIPIVGDILVGKKTGEGVVGVSFKMKGPPKDIKTTVNPIKTITPRFIVRAIEKMKKNNKEKAK